MKYLKYTWFAVFVLLAGCSLPPGTITIPPVPTAWIGGPPMATEEAEATAIVLATEEAPQEESTPVAVECLIKANVSANGSMIYHLPSGAYYDRVKVDESQGDKWFCDVESAEAKGFRRSLR